MADNLNPQQRRKAMAAVKSRNTSPERKLCAEVRALQRRFRLHDESLPGRPDLVFPRLRAVMFVHGCFWHSHVCQLKRKPPKNNATYWQSKLAGNRLRDRRVVAKLRKAGWRVIVIWECQIRKGTSTARVRKFLRTA